MHQMELQRRIEAVLEQYLPERTNWFPGRRDMIGQLLLYAHLYGLDMAVSMNRRLIETMSQPVIIVTSEEQAEKIRKDYEDARKRSVQAQDPGSGPGRDDPTL